MRHKARPLVWFCSLVGMVAVAWWPSSVRAEAGDELVVSVLTIGPGDHPFLKFGHNAILVEDKRAHTELVFNYGAFSFDSVFLIPKFLAGKYRYWLAVEDYRRSVARYAAENRSVTAQRLDLTAPEKRQVVDLLNRNALPDNRYYLYDYYRDNCSTRVRDVVDGAVSGALRSASLGPAHLTWRAHTQRLTADSPWVYFGLHATMGSVIDQPISVWQEAFLPARLQEQLREVRRPGGAPLVAEEVRVVVDRRDPVRTTPPRWSATLLGIGVSAGLGIAALGRVASGGHRFARVAFALALALVGLFSGLFGALFVGLWSFTNHDVAYHNENILQLSPLGLALAALAVSWARLRSNGVWLSRLAMALCGSAALGLLLKALPWFSQDNWQIIALFLPLWAGLAAGVHLATRRRAKGALDRPRSSASDSRYPIAAPEPP
ncbi:MAG TPA: DUF4105 domain-containing protein [Polyangiaceae bacterium]|nr:DUF4105 domain-containing protein [Polyangiaceae bacterium]